jgi:tetratricopeptide (TPR) repeat protein
MSSTDNQIQNLLRTAETHMKKGERDEALEALHRALNLDPGNEQVQTQVSSLEREISAMKTFKRTRNRRAHGSIDTVSSSSTFVDECLGRSQQAFDAGDEVRALQELERAKRHDPDNKAVIRRIKVVRRSIKANNLYDLAVTRLRSGEPFDALEQARKIFSFWPSSPVLEKLLDEIESHEKPVIEEPEEIDIEEIDELEEIEEAPTPEPAISPSEVVITSIREKIARSSFSEALAEATEGIKKFPDNSTLQKLLDKLEKIVGEPAPAAVSTVKAAKAPAKKPTKKADKKKPAAKPEKKPAKKPEKKREKEKPAAEPGRKKLPVGLIAVVALVVVALVVIFVVKPFGGAGREDVPVEPADQPYSVSYLVSGPLDPVFLLDGENVSPGTNGYFTISGSGDESRQMEIGASGYETLRIELNAIGGNDHLDTLILDTLGTSSVQLTFEPRMPEDEPVPDDGQIIWLVDGEEADELPVTLQTGFHVFQAVLDGYNSLPESILVDYSDDVQIHPLALLSQEESQISLSLASDVTGTANFYIDGTRVGSGVRRITEVVPHGTHSLSITMDEREDWYRTIDLGPDGFSQTVTPTSLLTTGRLLIGPEPWAEVFIDGASYGQTPMPPIELDEGVYSIRLSNPDYEEQTTSVTITAGKDVSIRYTAPEIVLTPDTISIVEEPVLPPFAIQQVAPVTPGLALDHGDVHGYVTLQVIVGTDGQVVNVIILNDELGLGCGQAAVDAAMQWVWNPATQGGVPVEVPTTIQMRFDID